MMDKKIVFVGFFVACDEQFGFSRNDFFAHYLCTVGPRTDIVNKRISVAKFTVNLCKDCYYRNMLILFAEKFAIVFF